MSNTTKNLKLGRKKKCCVKGCDSNSLTHPDICFHHFPAGKGRFVYITDYFGNQRQIDQLKAWKNILKIKVVTKWMKVCSRHFKKEDYLFPELPTIQRKLRIRAVPSCKLPNSNEKLIRLNNSRLERRLKREENKAKCISKISDKKESDCLPVHKSFKAADAEFDVHETVEAADTEFDDLSVIHNTNYNYLNDKIASNDTASQANECVCNFLECYKEKSILTKENEISNSYEVFEDNNENDSIIDDSAAKQSASTVDKMEDGIDITTRKLPSQDFGVQVDTELKFFKLIKTKQQLSTATGIESFEILKVIVESVKLSTNNKYEKETFSMKTEDRVVMTYVKLKQNLSYSFLALIFDCVTPQHCRTIFLETVRVLSKCLKLAIPWPSKKELSKNIPQCFEGFENTRIVVDCTEIFIQRPKNLCCQILTYSHYKGAQTAKIMTGVTPGGNISFISKPYGGRASDSAIFEQSDLVKLLDPKDGVMVDKGFLIEELCEKNQFRFIQPPFLRKQKKFSQQDSIYSAKVAKARVHVERSNQRIKVFKMLGSVMPVALVPYLQDIFTVICGTVNLSAPILGNEKFIHDELDET